MRGAGGEGGGRERWGDAVCVLRWDFSTLRPTGTSCYGADGSGCDAEEGAGSSF